MSAKVKKSKWMFADASQARYGSMICQDCNQTIQGGEYRYREAQEISGRFRFMGYFDHVHRACCREKQLWTNYDFQNEQEKNKIKERLSAFLAFRDKWKISDLDEEIEEMQNFLKKIS